MREDQWQDLKQKHNENRKKRLRLEKKSLAAVARAEEQRRRRAGRVCRGPSFEGYELLLLLLVARLHSAWRAHVSSHGHCESEPR
eukprot:949957-Pyramimonas_sp.AAC.1